MGIFSHLKYSILRRAVSCLICLYSLTVSAAEPSPTLTVKSVAKRIPADWQPAARTPVKSGRNAGFDRYVSIFAAPPGPSLPLGATLNPAANAANYFQTSNIRVSASATLVIVDFPPGARRVRPVTATQ